MGLFVRDKAWNWVAFVIALASPCSMRAERYQTAEDSAKPQAATSATVPPLPAVEAVEQQEQVVVLQDGGVMRGRVTRSGERYVLTRGTGETFIPASNVMLVAASLEEAYQQRRQRLGRPTADVHLILAEWCLRHELVARAEQDLAGARALEPQHDKLELLERRLALAKERQQKPAEVVLSAPAASQPAAFPMPPAQTEVGDLPPGAVELFTRKVQPVLVNSCTTAGCHELGGTTKFQLDRAVLRGMSNRRTTMHNLAATLALVDREQPRLSPLLTVPRQTHGGMKGPVFGPRREAAFRHLYEWVALMTAETAKPSPVASPLESVPLVAEGGEPLSHGTSTIQRMAQPADADNVPALYQEPADAELLNDGPSQSPGAANERKALTPLRYGARLEHWQPRDPFDPEIFNRKYAPKGAASANANSQQPVDKAER